MKCRLIVVLLLAAGSFVAAYVRMSDGIDRTTSAKTDNGMMEIEAEQMLANLGATCW
jgi:hypothetical protein